MTRGWGWLNTLSCDSQRTGSTLAALTWAAIFERWNSFQFWVSIVIVLRSLYWQYRMPKNVMESNRPQIYLLIDWELKQLIAAAFLTKGQMVFLFLLMSHSLHIIKYWSSMLLNILEFYGGTVRRSLQVEQCASPHSFEKVQGYLIASSLSKSAWDSKLYGPW